MHGSLIKQIKMMNIKSDILFKCRFFLFVFLDALIPWHSAPSHEANTRKVQTFRNQQTSHASPIFSLYHLTIFSVCFSICNPLRKGIRTRAVFPCPFSVIMLFFVYTRQSAVRFL